MSSDRIIIVGSGAYGLSSALHLSKAGYSNITVFDRGEYDTNAFSPLRGADGASTDLSKPVRASYVDKTHYQDLAVESIAEYYNWNSQLLTAGFLPPELLKLQELALAKGKNDALFQNTGYIRLDDIDSGEEERNLANFERVGLRQHSYDINNAADVARAKITGWYGKLDPLGQRDRISTLTGVLDSFAGVALADKCLLWVRHLCERSGNVNFVYGASKGAVKEINYHGGCATGVTTLDGVFHGAEYVVVAAGGWIPSLVPALSPRLESVASTYILIQIPRERKDLIRKYQSIPMINWRMTYESHFRADGVYVFPANEEGVLKMGLNDHFWRYLDSQNTSVPKTDIELLPKSSLLAYKKFIAEQLPDIAASGATIDRHKFCYAPLAQKNELVIDFVPGTNNLIVCSGGGFHGFKFLPVIGKFVEALVSGVEYEHQEKFRFDAVNEPNNGIVTDPRHKHALNGVEYTAHRSEYYDYQY